MRVWLTKIAEGEPLTREDAAAAMRILLEGGATPEQTAAFLVGLRARGESLEELVGLTSTMRAFAVEVKAPANAVDIVGTGGDRSGTFNISTTAAFVCAGAGAVVAKHGNRSVTSKCGSADVLEQLGVRCDLGAAGIEACLEAASIAFLFAPQFHPALRHIMPVRRGLGVRTCFNILGPLCNPAGVKRHMVGAFSREVARDMADVLLELGSESIITVHAHDGLDELSLSGLSTIFRSEGGRPVQEMTVDPAKFGFSLAPYSAVAGGTAEENARILKDVLLGEPGPRRDIVLFNAAFTLLAAGVAPTVEAGLDAARRSIDSGAAVGALERLVESSNRVPG